MIGSLVLAAVLSSGAGDSGDIAKRIAALHRKAEGVRPGSDEARAVSRELAEVGRAMLERGENGPAIELLEEACALDEQNGLALAQLTLAYVRSENFDFARFYLALAEDRSPRSPPEIYETLGEIYYAWNRLEDAVSAWEHSRRLGSQNPRTLARLSSALKELALTSGQRVVSGPSFTVHYDPAIPKDTVERVERHLSGVRREQAAFFGEDLPGAPVVVLYAGRAYFSLVSVPEWVSGVYDGKIRVSLDPWSGLTPMLEAVLTHELAHAFVRSVSRDRAPGWLHEGLAQWWEGERLPLDDLRRTFASRAPFSLDRMEGNLSRDAERAATRANYAQALGLVQYLAARSGIASVACVVRALGEGLSTSEALRRETGIAAEELVAEWRRWGRI